MTWTLGIEDLVVAAVFAGLIALARESLRRRLIESGHERRAEQRSRKFFLYALSYIVVFMVCGVLHQTGTLLSWPAYGVFGVLIVAGVLGWIRLGRVPANKDDH